MKHTQIVTATQLESYADTRDSEAVIPETSALARLRYAPNH